MVERQRLSGQVEVSPLMRTHGGLVLSQTGRQLQAALREEVAYGVLKKAQVAIAKDVAMDAMDAVAEVDSYRTQRAGSNQELNLVLCEVELGYIDDIKRIQRGRNL